MTLYGGPLITVSLISQSWALHDDMTYLSGERFRKVLQRPVPIPLLDRPILPLGLSEEIDTWLHYTPNTARLS